MPALRRVLILGGSAEARELAERLAPRFDVTTSLAGRVNNPRSPPVRCGSVVLVARWDCGNGCWTTLLMQW